MYFFICQQTCNIFFYHEIFRNLTGLRCQSAYSYILTSSTDGQILRMFSIQDKTLKGTYVLWTEIRDSSEIFSTPLLTKPELNRRLFLPFSLSSPPFSHHYTNQDKQNKNKLVNKATRKASKEVQEEQGKGDERERRTL